ncbi:Up-regulated during septation-domain-containing protein [Sordaria brevicollis]|uniref:Up-regulated during septation-domain-containing protein n=1 Tax=Sordaria brevicollis TaxID=83679 RepID=A0AAE0P363_SORBR|nr:Up-regulated during septation-domain-containing protein [Sordaria brevicollis]
MNGAATRKGAPPPLHSLGRSMTEGFDKARYTPVNAADRPRISAMVDLDDPIQIHLLMETALTDSKQWEIMSQEEVDDLKKQTHSLTIRIDQARANLAIQTKYRDAAVSMARLYNPGHRRHSSRDDVAAAREAEVEKQNSERLCNELSSELAMLENHLFDSQRRLLQHTAAILQLTHGARRRNAQTPNGQVFGNSMMVNGMPESPESLYTYTNSRDSISMEPIGGDDGFDWRTLHPSEGPAERSVTPAPTAAPTLTNLEIPPKSPIREQTSQLREEMERVKEENERLKAAEQKLRETENQLRAGQQELSAENDAIRTEINGQIRMFAETEQRLEILNHKLRDVITEINPSADANLDDPEPSAGNGQTLPTQLNYLERGLDMAMHEQQLRAAAINRDLELAGDASVATLSQCEKRIEALNKRAHGFLTQTIPDTPPPPTVSEGSLDEQLDYLESILRTIRVEMGRTQDSSANNNSSSANKSNSEQVEAVLMGLWDIIHTGYAEIQRAKAARRQKRMEMNLAVDEEDEEYLSGSDEAIDPNEQYSLQGFSAKVQWLYAQATSLKEQKAVLQRQIKQQRELNNKSGSEKDAELRAKMEELEKMRGAIDDAEARVHEAKNKMEDALEQMEKMQRTTAEREEAAMARGAQQTQDKLMERNAVIANLESKFNDVSTRLAETEADVVDLQSQLEQSAKAKAAAEKSQQEAEDVVDKLRKEIKDKDEELERMNMMLVEIKMEMTIAKAELDGAYGSRAERAAQAAAISNKSELADLQAQVAKLKMELESTLKDFEAITKESIQAEKEKLDLEHKLDDAMQAKESLETEVSELREKMEKEISRLKEELDKERLKPPPSPALSAAGSASGMLSPRMGATMLSEQFRATMKEERKRFNEEMKEELAKRRKLEEELRTLRRNTAQAAAGGLSPGLKSPLSAGALSTRS